MNDNLAKTKELLKSSEYTCVLVSGESVYTSNERGVKPLPNLLQSDTNLKGYSAADKVVGKAAAFLYVLLGVKEVYATVISKPAVAVLHQYGISVSYDLLVEMIRNRTDTGYCPMEQATKDISDPEEALSVIKQTLAKLKS